MKSSLCFCLAVSWANSSPILWNVGHLCIQWSPLLPTHRYENNSEAHSSQTYWIEHTSVYSESHSTESSTPLYIVKPTLVQPSEMRIPLSAYSKVHSISTLWKDNTSVLYSGAHFSLIHWNEVTSVYSRSILVQPSEMRTHLYTVESV